MARTSDKIGTKVNGIDTHNKVTPAEFKKILKSNMQAILKNPSLSSVLRPIHCSGSPGNGKSSIIKSVADELGIEFVDFRMSTHEAVDLRGLPVPNRDSKSVDWYPTSELPKDPNFKGILLFDELDACSLDLQVAVYEIVLDRKIGNIYKVPPGCMIVAAGNLATDRAAARPMSSALANRFLHVELENTAENWVEWGDKNNIHPAVTGFIRFRPEYLFHMEGECLERGWPSPRSWEGVSSILHLFTSEKAFDEHILRKTVYGLVGNRAGIEFMEFWKLNEKFDNVLEWMVNPNAKIDIPDRQDIRYAITSSMIYLLWKGKDEVEESKRIDGFFRISMCLPADFASMAMNSAIMGDADHTDVYCCDKLCKHPKYKEWSTKYGKSLRKRINIGV